MEIILTSCADEWTEITGSFNNFSGWINTASSFDGKCQYISTDQHIFCSFDSGDSWNKITENFSGIKAKSLTVSSGGNIIGLIDYKNIQISFNSGNSWINDIITGGNFKDWKKISFSSDGKYMTALGFQTEIYISENSGVTWKTGLSTSFIENWASVSMSSNGEFQLAAAKSGSLWTSSDYGNNWENVLNNVPRTFFISGAKELLKGVPVLYPGDSLNTHFLISGKTFFYKNDNPNLFELMALPVTGSYKLYNLNTFFEYYSCPEGVQYSYDSFFFYGDSPSNYQSNPIQGIFTGNNSEIIIKIQSGVAFPENTFYILEIENLLSNNQLYSYNNNLNTYDWFSDNTLIQNGNYYLINNC